jgi:nucleoside-diphosphate-sugar epimerase
MKKILVTGGTTFVSKYTAKYFADHGYDTYVLNRGSKPQVEGVTLLKGDRHDLDTLLKSHTFDAVLDITSYNDNDINDLLNGLGSFGSYIFISSSAVYPETEPQPFAEDAKMSENKFWGKYGTDKIAAEKALLSKVPDAYILRPPYLYGPMNNVYREAFVFDCVMSNRKFYLPGDGDMKLQFFHVDDLCKLMEIIINESPSEHIMNVGNADSITIKDWVTKCYACFGKTPEFVNVRGDIEQRQYFSFYNYEYALDVNKMLSILPETIDLDQGLAECADWYKDNSSEVRKKPFFDFIDGNLAGC